MTELLRSLIRAYADGVITPEQFRDLQEQLRTSAAARELYLQEMNSRAALDDLSFATGEPSSTVERPRGPLARWPLARWAGAVAAVLALAVSAWVLLWTAEREIVTVVRADGDVRWTGDGGTVVLELEPGRDLPGGTLETLTVESFAELRFRDGSTAALSGVSKLVVSEVEQKKLHLGQGHLSVTVKPQPKDRPLLVLTPAAELQVLGTRFDVTVDANRTKLTVDEGTVRCTRRTDRDSVDVPAAHQVVVSVEAREELRATQRREATSSWRADLESETVKGRWVSAFDALRLEIGREIDSGRLREDQAAEAYRRRAAALREGDGSVFAQPERTGRDERARVGYVVAFEVSPDRDEPVVLARGSKIAVRGRVASPAAVVFSIGVVGADGRVVARYVARRNVEGVLDLTLPLDEFRPRDPARGDPVSPVGLELRDWSSSTFDRGAELQISGVGLVAPE